MPEINITIAGLEENGFRQESLRKEQDWAQSPLAKELRRSSQSWARRLKVTSLPCRDASTTQHCLFFPGPSTPSSRHSSPAALFEGAALSPVLSRIGVFLLPKGLQDTEPGCSCAHPSHLTTKTRFGPFLLSSKAIISQHGFLGQFLSRFQEPAIKANKFEH